MEYVSLFLQKLLEAVLPVLAAALVAVLYAWFKKLWAQFKNEQPNAADVLEWLASVSVKAAEQAKLAGLAEDKKKYALDFAEKWLAAKGLSLDLDLLDKAIEGAVWEEFGRDKKQSSDYLSQQSALAQLMK